MMQDDDFSQFAREMGGVRRIKVEERADTGKRRTDRQAVQERRVNAQAADASAIKVDGLSDLFVIDVGAEDELYWAGNGLQETQMRRLKQGQIPFEGSIDLHGMTVEKARTLLWDFFAEARKHEVRCVRVTHGKAARIDGRKPMIKSHVNTWLRQHEHVLGFCSCQARHGGTGAVYVLLRRHMMEGRDDD